MPREFDPFRLKIRQVLLNDWDPSNASRFESASGEYDGYVDPIAELIESGAGEEAIVDYLFSVERETMCFPGLDKRRLVRVARKLLAIEKSE